MKICFLAVGGELLKGRIVNTNLTQAGLMLREHGYNFTREVVIPDDREAILKALREELQENDVIIMSGGLGPTKDDITKKTIAEYFQTGFREDTETMERLRAFFEYRKIPFTDKNAAQALVPENCEVMINKKGTAPGMCFSVNGKLLFSMPGVPFEMLYLLEYEVLPRMKAAFPPLFYQNHILRVWGMPESFIADRIEKIEKSLPESLDISYLPRLDGVWLECTLKGNIAEKKPIAASLEHAVSLIKEVLTGYVYTEGQLSLPEEILALFTQNQLTLAVAESMTGGNIMGKLVQISGTSAYLKGGFTVYFTEMKTRLLGIPADLIEEKGVVSEEVATLMASKVRELTGADVGLSITGFAQKPDKTTSAQAWIGYSDKSGDCAKHETFISDREVNISRAVSGALIFLLRNVRELIADTTV